MDNDPRRSLTIESMMVSLAIYRIRDLANDDLNISCIAIGITPSQSMVSQTSNLGH